MSIVVPFHELIGIEILEVGNGTSKVLAPDTPELKNHFGTMHGGMLFTLGEISAAVCFTRTMGKALANLRAITREAKIKYLKPAKGAITGVGSLAMSVEEILSASESGPIDVPISVTLSDDTGTIVAELDVLWYVSTKQR